MVVRVLRCAGPAQDVGQRERDDRPGRDGPCTAAGDDEVRLDALIEAVGRIEQAPEGCPRRGEPERRPVARRVGPRGDPQLTEPVPEPVAVELERGPAQHMVEDRIVGLWWDEGGAHDHRRTDDPIFEPEGGIRDRPDPAVVADLDVFDRRAVRSARVASPLIAARRLSSGGSASSVMSSARAWLSGSP